MVWVKLEDQIPHHPKFVAAGAVASWLWVCGNCHCNKYLTDGFISHEALPTLGVVPKPQKEATRLVLAGLWEAVDGGFNVHDFLDFNPSRADVLRDRAERHTAKVTAGRAGGLAKAKQTASRNLVERQSHASQSAKTGTWQNGSPVPSRPVPKDPDTHSAREAAPPDEPRKNPLITAGAHRKHASCGRVCVPADLHDSFVRRSSKPEDEAERELRAWYPVALAAWEGRDLPGGDDYAFWRDEYERAHPSAPKKRTGGKDFDGMVAAFSAGAKS